ncbi:FAD-binding oxidoreductase [bacterium]|nr:FAD-binding oxidoreductase [bacterium]
MKNFKKTPTHDKYDVIIIGGAIMGSSTAWFLSQNPDFNGTILVVEKDQKYEFCSTAHTTSCIRQQFSTTLNVEISQFAANFINNFQEYMDNDIRVPKLTINSFGYMYLAADESFAKKLRNNQKIQAAAGAATQILTPEEIKLRYPFYRVEDIKLGSINLVNEGYWDSIAVFEWMKTKARENGVEYVENEVIEIIKNKSEDQVISVKLASGEIITAGKFVNATGPRAAVVSKMAGIEIPVEPRKRYSWIFKAEKPLDRDLPLTIDPSGFHVRENGGGTYQAGGHGFHDPAVNFDDFIMDDDLWENTVWPILFNRIPQFESLKLISQWAGHYAMNTLDQNAIIGPHNTVQNFFFQNGFSGHGTQQAPAMGRAIAEILTYGCYKTIDMSAFKYERLLNGHKVIEEAII